MVRDGHGVRPENVMEVHMQYLLLLYSEESGWSRMTPAAQEQAVAAYGAYGEALKKAGVYLGSNRLQSVSTATTVRVADGKSQVLNGPYAESREQLGGYYLIEAETIDEALDWAGRIPTARRGSVEVRPIQPVTVTAGEGR